MATTDDKRRLLQDIDKGFDIEFHPDIESYIITHNGGHFQTVKYGDFNQKLLQNIRRVVYLNINGDMARQIDEHNEKIHSDNQRREDDMIEQAVKDIGKPLYRELFG
jgi:hypothetical protein